MSNSIRPVSQPVLPDPAGNPSAAAPAATQGAQGAQNAGADSGQGGSGGANSLGSTTEAVTLSAAAQASTALLNAARTSQGVDQTTVAAIKTALANGTYNVAPEDLAQAIATVLKETQP